MTHGRPLAYIVVAGLLVLGAVAVLSVREQLPTWLVLGVVIAVLAVVGGLLLLARRKR